MKWHVAEKELEPSPVAEVLLTNRLPHEAVPFLESELSRAPNSIRWLNNTAIAYRQLGRFAEAEKLILKAIELNPKAPEPWHNLGHILEDYGRWAEAEDNYIKAIALSKGGEQDRLSRFALGACLMQRYEFGQAWKFWAEGRDGGSYPILPEIPQWRGEELDGKRIIVMREGGYGDIFLMFRYLGELKKRGAHVTFHSWNPLVEFIEGHPWVDRAVGSRQIFDLDDFDYQISIQSIMEFVEPCPLPMTETYFWAKNPKNYPYPAVGLCWPAGEVVNPYRKYRSIPREAIECLKDIPVHWVSLQVSEPTPEWMEPTEKNWKKTADVIAGLDLVISSNTSVCHLAAAMGKPTWLILQLNSEWFWFLEREDSPWYLPSFRIFRNPDPLDFSPAIARVKEALQNWTG